MDEDMATIKRSDLVKAFRMKEEGVLYGLTGKELSEAVCKAHDWILVSLYGLEGWRKEKRDCTRYSVGASGYSYIWEPGSMYEAEYSPSTDRAQAMDLIVELWDGRHPRQHNDAPPVVSVVKITLSDSIPQEVSMTAFSPTLADVHMSGEDFCEVACKLYLKVVGWTPEEEEEERSKN